MMLRVLGLVALMDVSSGARIDGDRLAALKVVKDDEQAAVLSESEEDKMVNEASDDVAEIDGASALAEDDEMVDEASDDPEGVDGASALVEEDEMVDDANDDADETNVTDSFLGESATEGVADMQWTVDGCAKVGSRNRDKHLSKWDTAAVRCCSYHGQKCESKSVGCKRQTYPAAAQTCAARGKRLCSWHEMKTNLCCGTGCNFDLEPAWVLRDSYAKNPASFNPNRRNPNQYEDRRRFVDDRRRFVDDRRRYRPVEQRRRHGGCIGHGRKTQRFGTGQLCCPGLYADWAGICRHH